MANVSQMRETHETLKFIYKRNGFILNKHMFFVQLTN